VKVAVLGLGYVGLPLAVRAAEVGHSVIGIDLDKRKLASLYAGTSYIEDVTDDRLVAVSSSGRLRFSPELLLSHREFDICVVTVPTPLVNGEPDLSYVVAAGEDIGRVLVRGIGSCVVLESTSYPGTTEEVFAAAIARTSNGAQPGKDYLLGFSPERIDPGASEHTLENTPKLISGTTVEALARIQEFYDTIVEQTVPVTAPKVAELAKVFENLQAYVNIALVNEMAEFCRDLDIDVHEVIDAAMTKGHSMAYWVPGPGVGGHCLPIDSLYIAWQARQQLGRPFKMAELAAEINGRRPHYVVDRAVSMLTERGIATRDACVLVLGVAYKPGVGDLRESPALDIVADLTGRGAQVVVCDPLVENWTMTPVLPVEELTGAIQDFDLAIVVTDHPSFDFDKLGHEARLVLDTRNAVRPMETVVPL
jgi:UDP-N-acetyl-D-glucosamine dehydrogenase